MIHQNENHTSLDRYPSLFAKTKGIQPNPKKIMSFGCSTGEECTTLRKYYPEALIVGIEINREHLLVAKAIRR